MACRWQNALRQLRLAQKESSLSVLCFYRPQERHFYIQPMSGSFDSDRHAQSIERICLAFFSAVLNTSKSRPSNTQRLLVYSSVWLAILVVFMMLHDAQQHISEDCCEETHATGECSRILLAGGSIAVKELTDFTLQCFGPSRSACGSYTGFGVLRFLS